MFGRSCGLLVSTFLFALQPFTLGQDHPVARPQARLPIESPIPRMPIRIFPVQGPPLRSPGVLGFPQFTRAAGMIFSGTVTKIERQPARRGQLVETVALTFHVEKAIHGASAGRDVIIRQWIGLWSSGQRYAVGERVLVFLYPKSKLGLTSSVGGELGRFAVDASGRVMLNGEQIAAFQRDPVLGGKSRARIGDFALAVRHAHEEE